MDNIVKRSVKLGRHKTSVSLEEPFWTALKEIAREEGMGVSALVLHIDNTRERGNLSSALRVFVLDHYRTRVVAQPKPIPVDLRMEVA